ncbi:MAG: DUF4397 domain-containing protein [Ignavibacteriales bacterium]|nr:DUF4397 domain-containing protein [Ignavibacteriales bacterium]
MAAYFALASLLIVGCSDDDSPTSPELDKANVKVVHASPDAPGVDLLVDNNIAGSNLTYPNNTGYLQVDEGTRNVKVNVSGTSTTVIEADLPIEGNKNYSVFAIDAVANLSPLVIEDDLTSPASGTAHARFIHLSPDAPAVDITTKDGTVVFGNYKFKDYSQFTPLPAGSYDLQVRLAGTETVVLELNGINLTSGKIYTVFAKGFVAGTSTQALGAEIIVNK